MTLRRTIDMHGSIEQGGRSWPVRAAIGWAVNPEERWEADFIFSGAEPKPGAAVFADADGHLHHVVIADAFEMVIPANPGQAVNLGRFRIVDGASGSPPSSHSTAPG